MDVVQFCSYFNCRGDLYVSVMREQPSNLRMDKKFASHDDQNNFLPELQLLVLRR